jgi:hypothetical protein
MSANLARIAVGDDGGPQDQQVDTTVVVASRGVLRYAERCFCCAQGCTQGTRPASSSAIILSVISA